MYAVLREPFPIASDASKAGAADNVLVTLTDADGVTGLGEAAPYHGISGDTQALLTGDLSRAAPMLRGKEWDVEGLNRFAARTLAFPASRAAVEMAFFDILAKKEGEPLFAFFNERVDTIASVTDITIPLVEPSKAAELARRYLARGFHRIKIKVGDEREKSFQRVSAAWEVFDRAGMESKLEIAIDANEGFCAADAIALLRRLCQARIPVKIFEQPVRRNDRTGLKQVTQDARQWGTMVIADESVFTEEEARALAENEAVHGFNLKLMKHGGLTAASRIALIAAQHGLYLMAGGMVETRLAMTAMYHLAVALGNVFWLDLDTPLLLDAPMLAGGIQYVGARIFLPEVPGIGVSLAP